MEKNGISAYPQAKREVKMLRASKVIVFFLLCLLATNSVLISCKKADNAEMAPVPAGEFIMGSSGEQIQAAFELCKNYRNDCEQWFENELPARRVYLDAFHIDKYEVTVAQYAGCVKAGKCSEPTAGGYYCNWKNPDRSNHPVNCVDWRQASDFCEWAGKRLPTEAEWEKAARGRDGRIYPWGDDWVFGNADYCDTLCEYEWRYTKHSDGYKGTAPVGSFPGGASPYGVMDMSGNVFEWTADYYDEDYYNNGPLRNPKGPSSGENRVLRGGSWASIPVFLRSPIRANRSTDIRNHHLGFRCAKSP